VSPPAGRRPGGGSGAELAGRLLLAPVRLLATDLGRRLATVVVLTTLFVGVMSLLYEHAEHPTANARPAATTTEAPAPPATKPAARPPVARPADRPEAVAAGWYARRLGLPAGRVRALGSQRLGAGRVRVLVLAETAGGRQATVWVPLRRTRAGWTVAR
jgi:hypothetical protein